MTKEQKEAIEYFKKRIDICMENANICDENDFDEEASCLRKEQYLIETVLNLIKTQQEEIEKKDKIIDELEDIFYNYQLCEYELTDCTYRKCEYIADDENSPCKECIKQYFEKEVSDICVGD